MVLVGVVSRHNLSVAIDKVTKYSRMAIKLDSSTTESASPSKFKRIKNGLKDVLMYLKESLVIINLTPVILKRQILKSSFLVGCIRHF
jgi:hypothetical protein